MIDSGLVQNMKGILSNKYEKQCISLAFIIRIPHAARSSGGQKGVPSVIATTVLLVHTLHHMHVLNPLGCNYLE